MTEVTIRCPEFNDADDEDRFFAELGKNTAVESFRGEGENLILQLTEQPDRDGVSRLFSLAFSYSISHRPLVIYDDWLDLLFERCDGK